MLRNILWIDDYREMWKNQSLILGLFAFILLLVTGILYALQIDYWVISSSLIGFFGFVFIVITGVSIGLSLATRVWINYAPTEFRLSEFIADHQSVFGVGTFILYTGMMIFLFWYIFQISLDMQYELSIANTTASLTVRYLLLLFAIPAGISLILLYIKHHKFLLRAAKEFRK